MYSSVLIDYHNNLLNLLEQEMNSNDNHIFGALKNLVNNLTSKEVSILQIVHDNTGMITLTDNDCLSIEQLSCATLINENDKYFQQEDTKFNFDFIYFQSYIIRTYLLFCRINYRHISQNYQCHRRRTQTITDGEILDLDEKYSIELSHQQLENDWNHLKDMYLDKLYHGHNFLRQITIILKNYQDDLSQINLYAFVQSLDNDNNLFEQSQQYEIKDFQLCYIDHIRQLYSNSISGFQHLFTDVSQLLRIPIDIQLDDELNQMLTAAIISIDYNDNIDKIKFTIQTITDLLNDLRSIEHFLLRQSTYSLKETYDILNIENSILAFIPNEIKCENYVAVSIHLIRMRTILQERIVNIEEKQTKQWNENFNIKSFDEQEKQVNRFLDFLNEPSISNETSQNITYSNDNDIWSEVLHETTNYPNIDNLLDHDDLSRQPQNSTIEEHLEYSSLFELHIKFVPLTLSNLFEEIHKQCQEVQTQVIPVTKAQRFVITHPDGKVHTYLWKSENLFEKLRNLFDKEKYDINTFVVVDKNEIFIDFTNRNIQLQYEISLEYFIIEKILLFSIQFNYQRKLFEYFATSKSNISIIINRFINDNNIKLSSNNIYLCFFDQHGKSIDDRTIADVTNQIDHLDNKTISITVTQEDNQTSMLCEVTLRTKQNTEHTSLFHPTTKWQQIEQWLKNFIQLIDSPVKEFAFFDKEQKTIIDENQSICSTIEQTKSAIIDGISRDITTNVTFSYENNSVLIYALKSMRICHVLNNERLLRQLHLIDISPNDCVLVLGEINERILSQDDIRQPIGNYLNTNNEPIHFRISIAIQILKYDDQQPLQILLSNRNTTIQHIFQLTQASIHIYKYLASNYSKKILDYNEKLSNLIDTKFILVKECETCLVSIKKPKTNQLIDIDDEKNEIYQRFTIFATIGDIYRENQIDIDHQNLLYSEDFVPSIETQLICFSSISPIRFTLINGNLPITVIIVNMEDQQSIKFYCSLTITVKRLSFIACQLFNLNKNYYRLMHVDCLLDDDEVSLDDIDSTMSQIQFQLISTASKKSSVRYDDQTVVLPCSNETSAATIIKETLKKLHIPQENCHIYELMALADDRTPIESDMSIDDVYELFPSRPTTIPFELIKNKE
ncbi:unnamed protein product [Rotaria sp. Silwood2]|nr:unnamed protein product [Rotaria sp. Silwood2]